MKSSIAFAALNALLLSGPVLAQSKSDDKALRALPIAFSEAWAKHDGHALASIMADDVDFVTVGATWFHGRRDFEIYHTRLLSGRFKGSTNKPLETSVRFIRRDLATVRWSWVIDGDKNPDGTVRPRRFGLTMLAEKRKGLWLVAAAQNTNAAARPSPEASDIISPIAMPDAN
jgi:uncharacterized protein (TIGR02246 family)